MAWTKTETKTTAAIAVVALCAWFAGGALVRRADAPPELSALPPREDPVVRRETSSLTAPPTPTAALEHVPSDAREELAVSNDDVDEPAPVREPSSRASIELDVRSDGAPFAGVDVWLVSKWEVSLLDLLDARAGPPPGAHHGTSGRDGSLRMNDLEFDAARVLLNAAGGARPDRVLLGEAYSGHVCRIELGTAVLTGTVWDETGRPRAGVGIQAALLDEPIVRIPVAAFALTDELGRYRIEHLAAGEHRVTMDPDARFDGFGEPVQRTVELERGQELTLDFGSAEGTASWEGNLLNAFGQPFPGTGRLWLRGPAGEAVGVPVGGDGRFECALTPGAWHVNADVLGAPSGGFDLGEIVLDGMPRESDLVVPGARLEGRLFRSDGELATCTIDSHPLVGVRPSGHDYPGAIRQLGAETDGTYRFDGLEPGTWVVTTWPVGLDAPDDRLVVTIGEDDRLVTLDLRLR